MKKVLLVAVVLAFAVSASGKKKEIDVLREQVAALTAKVDSLEKDALAKSLKSAQELTEALRSYTDMKEMYDELKATCEQISAKPQFEVKGELCSGLMLIMQNYKPNGIFL